MALNGAAAHAQSFPAEASLRGASEAAKVLFVDDDSNVLAAYSRQLRKRFSFFTAQGGAEALKLAKSEGPFAVVVSDMKMPVMNGVELLQEFARLSPDSVRMMLTGNADQETAVRAVNDGHIFRFLTKPCLPEELAGAIEAGLAQYALITAERELLEKTLAGSVKVLVDVLALVDPEAFSRTRLLRELAGEIAGQLGHRGFWQLDLAAMLSPIGRITLPAEVTAKLAAGRRLDSDEQAMVARLPEISRDLIANIPRLQEVSEIIYYQGKGHDGSGFPERLVTGPEIPLGARILRLANDLVSASGGQPCNRAVVRALGAEAQRYDPAVLAAVRTLYLDGDDEDEAAQPVEPLALPISRLRSGDVLTSDIETEAGQLILAGGAELTQVLIEKLRNLHKLRHLREPVYVLRPSPASSASQHAAAAS